MENKRLIRITIILALVCTIIICIISIHLLSVLSSLIQEYNILIEYMNKNYNTTYSKQKLWWFSHGGDGTIVIDIIFIILFIIIGILAFLIIYWISTKKI